MMTMFDVRSGSVLAVAAALCALALGACADPADGPAAATLAGSETTGDAGPGAGPEIAPSPTGGETPSGGLPWDAAASAACEAVVPDAFTEVAQTADGRGVTSFWTRGRHWVACDVAGDAEPVLIESRAGRAGFDEQSLALTSAVVSGGDDPAVRFVAAGLLPWPVDEVGYAFPDGHTETARFVSSQDASEQTWWAVTYTATDGPLVDPETDAADLGPATISIVGAAAEAFRLPWEDLQRSE